MMGATKYPIIEQDTRDILLKLLGACRDDEQRGLVRLLWYTGMHPCCFASPRKKGDECRRQYIRVSKMGNGWWILWRRAKTGKELRMPVPKEDIDSIKSFLAMRAKSNKHYNDVLEAIGRRAGYDEVSCLTLRHTLCVRALTPKERGGLGMSSAEVASLMGCTEEVLWRNYAQLRMDQIVFHQQEHLDAEGGELDE